MRSLPAFLLFTVVGLNLGGSASAQDKPAFRAGAAVKDITPPPGLPMWGYAARHDALSTGVLDPLKAKAVVIEADGSKLAIVATDLGRGPTSPMLAEIRQAVLSKAGIKTVLVTGSHTHHGPVLELNDNAGQGGGKFDAAVAYNKKLPSLITEAILEADKSLRPAKLGTSREKVQYNRNRQAKKRAKVTDPNLTVVRLDDEAGKPVAVLVNFAAHPTMTKAEDLRYSADYPAALAAKVEGELNAPCLFLQGASGDLSANTPPNTPGGPMGFGTTVGTKVAELARTTTTNAPASPSLASDESVVKFQPRIDLKNPLVQTLYSRAFFPELIACETAEHGQGVDVGLSVTLLNREIAIVGVSGEFFCDHANRLRERLDVKEILFLGYCNGHHFYFPTIEAASDGGYGTEPGMSLAELGAGERLMDQALITAYKLLGKLPKVGR